MGLLVAGNVATMGSYAFCCGFQPGAADEKPLIDTLTILLGAPPSIGLMSSLRRLFYESHTLSLLDMRTRVETTDEPRVRRVQLPERVQRMAELKARYPGLSIVGETEFSYSLFDKALDQYDKNELRFIPLDECTRRDQETEGLRRDIVLSIEVQRDDSLRMGREQIEPRAQVATDLQIRNALVRRGLAYDCAGLITFTVVEAWIQKIFRLIQEPPLEG